MEKEKRLLDISKTEKSCSFILPDEYIDFLKQNEGYSDGALIIYDISELEETNDYTEIAKYAEGYIAIGDDGAGLIFLMKQERTAKEVIIVDMSYVNVNDPYQIINDFLEWQKNVYPINEDRIKTNNYMSEVVDIILLKMPEEGIKSILKIRKGLDLQNSVKELLEMTKKLPVVLAKDVAKVRAERLISEIGYEDLFELRMK